ncbi:hypothetical protein, partial [Eubacterium aggregans]|uniref:hypothetical protein n=1 Tax=Eubacterium aggregans TaxID=81409 RepID=UPI003F2AD439
ILRYLIGAALIVFWQKAVASILTQAMGIHLGILVSNLLLMLLIYTYFSKPRPSGFSGQFDSIKKRRCEN